MKNSFYISMALFACLLIMGCSLDPLCKEPRIRIGNLCCLDTNNDSYCDIDDDLLAADSDAAVRDGPVSSDEPESPAPGQADVSSSGVIDDLEDEPKQDADEKTETPETSGTSEDKADDTKPDVPEPEQKHDLDTPAPQTDDLDKEKALEPEIGSAAYFTSQTPLPQDGLEHFYRQFEEPFNYYVEDSINKVLRYDKLKTKSNVWDGEKVSVNAAKGEYESFQIVISANKEADVNAVFLEPVGDFRYGQMQYSQENIHLYYVAYVDIEKPSGYYTNLKYYPSASSEGVAESLSENYAGSYPDALTELTTEFFVRSDQSQPVWVEFYVPEDTAAGTYEGSIALIVEGKRMNIPVSLNVWDFSIGKPDLDMVGIIDDDSLTQIHKVKSNSQDYYTLEEKYADFLGAHYVSVGKVAKDSMELSYDPFPANVIDNQGRLLRSIPWAAFALNKTSINLLTLNSWQSGLWDMPLTYTDDGLYLNGPNMLVYNGNNARLVSGQKDVEGPVASIRLKQLRDAAEDYAMLLMVKEKSPSAFDKINSLIIKGEHVVRDPQGGEHDYVQTAESPALYYRAREMMAKELS